jgi:hypothetical protein
MTPVRWITLAALGVIAAAASPAAGHIQPSTHENNRYLKLTPFGDRLRLAYTIYFGDVPGAALRRQLDANRDGEVDAAEADELGRRIEAEVRHALTVTLDGTDVPIAWDEIEVGMGTPAVAAGTFAIDLIATMCVGRGPHALVIRDDYPLPIAGETELRVEPALGVTVVHVAVGGSAVIGEDVRIRGTGGPLAEPGWEIKLDLGAAAKPGGAGCGAAGSSGRTDGHGDTQRRWMLVAGAIGLGAVAIGAAIALRRARRRRQNLKG